jgi:2-aminoadipate transaminase
MQMTMPNSSNSPPVVLSAKGKRTQEAPISALIAAAVGNPDLISLAAGLVDPLTLPVEECLAITQRILSDRARAQHVLQYDTTLGLKPLRHEVLAHLQRLEGRPAEGLGLTADDLIITTGSQQALYLIADVLLDPGDIVIAGNPSYFVFTGTLQSLGAQVISVPMDADGMDVDAIERMLHELHARRQLDRVKFIYCVSFFDNPTGLSLSLERRKRLIEIVRRFSRTHRILILEDAAYRELRYDGEALPSIKCFDPANEFVALTQTFSKPFAPGIKLGYTVMPKGLLNPVLHQKGNHDFGSANICQHIALETLRDGSYARHLDVLKAEYRRKRDAMLAALQRYMPPSAEIRWTHPHGGLYVWLTLPASINTAREGFMFQQCLDRGVLYVPGEYCFTPDAAGNVPRNHMRLSFGQVAFNQIEPGIQRLAEVVRHHLAGHASAPCAWGGCA